jgi:hypothetical protein
MPKKSTGFFVGASLLVTLLSGSFLFLAPIPARYMHLYHGRVAYWIFSVLSTLSIIAVAPQWAFSQAAVLILIGLFSELEEMDVPTFYAATAAIIISALTVFLMALVWGKYTGVPLLAALKTNVADVITQYKSLRGADVEKIDVATVLSMFPAIISATMMLMVFVGGVFVRSKTSAKAIYFKVPALGVWVFIAALAGTFFIDPIKAFYLQKALSNVLFFMSAAYYFQGLAILGFFFQKLKVNYFLRTFLFFVVGLHLFIFVAGLGLSDVWFEYRSKVYKKSENRVS